MGRWLDAVDNADSSVANSAKSANRSDLRTKMPQNIPFGANGTIGTEQKPLTPLAQAASKFCSPPTNLDRQDWLDFYEERAAILENDGGVTCEQAERLAYEACVVALTWALTADYPRDRCTACGNHLGPPTAFHCLTPQ